jgi:Peptidase family C25
MKNILKILPYFFLIISATLDAQSVKDSPSSVLSSGKWVRIAVTKDGVYKIDYSRLSQLGLENPSNPKIYCNNSGQLSFYNNKTGPDDLQELAIYISGNDNSFNDGEYLLFFGQGTNRWIFNDSTESFDFQHHNYSDTAYYFLTSGSEQGKKISKVVEPSQSENYSSSESDALIIHEADEVNIISSGREWFEPISVSNGININHDFTDIITSEPIKIEIRVAARASISTIFRLYDEELLKKSIQVQSVNLFNYTGTHFQIADSSFSTLSGSASPKYKINFYNNGEPGAKGWLDYVKIHGRKTNHYTGKITQYTDYRSIGQGRITRFSIQSPINDVIIWNVSDPLNTTQIQYSKTGDKITFKSNTDDLKTFIAFSSTNLLTPIINPGILPNQDLHTSDPADMIIITHPLFRSYAEKLANIHLNNSGLISQVVTTEQIYNEFSGGIPDICAIRNFVRLKYQNQKGSMQPLKYLLLFGDGSYENKTLPPDNPNFIPTYQSQNSNVIVSSFTSDDFYGLLDDDEGEAEGLVDVGIGRLPASDTTQAGILLSKIISYLDPANMGDWKNVINITADDEDGNTHMYDAEGLASTLQNKAPSFNIEKIYLDAFKQTTSVNGQSYPDVNRAINDRINEGCLIFNYVGHGSENGLSHERVIKTDDINSWSNKGKLPLFITATCEFSRFDDIDINIITRELTGKPSAGEMVLMNKEGGGIALMSTTRVVYSAPNHFLNNNIFNSAFDRDESGNSLRLGDIIRLAKNNSGSGYNKRNFTLLGDPAVRLAYPWHGKVITDSINNVSVFDNIDSLQALSLITVAGHIENNNGDLLDTFNGVVSPKVYDKASKITTLANDGGQTMVFNLINNIIFSGKTMAKNGRFHFTFIVPRDIDYSYGTGKISYYANNFNEDMNGDFSGITVGGFSNIALFDTVGPEIKLFMNDTLFRTGGITDNNPKLLAIIKDAGGINTTGSGIGHDLTGYLDNDPNKSFLLNSYFENDFDNYMTGKINYSLSGLSGGEHYLTLKAWDNYNNSSVETIIFIVETGDNFVLKNLLNYPNPFLRETNIRAEHNRPDATFDVTLNIFNLNGRIIKIIKTKIPATGYTTPPIVWNGCENGGNRVGKGIYPYTIIVTTENGETAKTSGRMIIL